ncbi:MAG: isoprenylcysteine carboxylmethyltransferase family protein [Smithella sp.]|jgi:protein-S-isoprenylcysteine O-methyltransferase Ste14
MHVSPVFVYPEAVLFWIAFVWSFCLEIKFARTLARNPANTQDAGTRLLIKVGNRIAFFLAFLVSFLPWLVIAHPRMILDAGTGLLIVGSMFRQYSIRILGKYFTPEVIVNADHKVIERGPYRWIRHPGYTAAFIMFLGVGLAFGNWLCLVVLFGEACFVYRRRVMAEENALLDTIGEPYRAYMAQTKRFIPFIY